MITIFNYSLGNFDSITNMIRQVGFENENFLC
jgi:hypothetical protein